MQSGWVKLHRGLLEWEWYKDANTRGLFIHCLLRANHADNSWRGKEIKRGSFFTSLDTLSTETGLTSRQIRTSLDKLIATGEVSSSGQARGRMITIANYDSYQSDDKLNDSEKSGKSQAHDRLSTTNKNDKNDKNDKNINKPTPVKPKYEDCDLEFANQAFKEILKVSSDYKKPNLETWAKDVRLMREVDGKDLSEMATVWIWVRQDRFWSTNVLSISKFRDKYEQLKMKMNEVNNNGSSNKYVTAQQQRIDQNAKAFDYDHQMNQLEGL